MKKVFEEQLSIAEGLSNDSEKLTYLTSVLRSLLQLAVISTFEITHKKTPSDEVNLSELTDRFCRPSDGLPLQIIDALTPQVRAYVDKQFLHGWFESTSTVNLPLSKQLIEWVNFRNKRPGHGVLDSSTTADWSTKTKGIILDSLKVFSEIIPKVVDDKDLVLPQKFDNLVVDTPLLFKEKAIVILGVLPRKGTWKLRGQILSNENAQEFSISLPENNIFNTNGLKQISEYSLADIISNDDSHSFFHNIPVRQTDTFEGRGNELNEIKEWIDDEDSRFCLIYGDGGFGKTTLVLEMLNQILESEHDFNQPLPQIISYHTAKMTRWTEEGLVHLTAISPVMDECIRELMRCFFPVLSHDWYKVSGRSLLDKAVSVLKDNKFTRDDVLLIIDNTETLATNPDEVKELGAFFKTIGKLLGRIIITSRRREFIEATPIVVEGLSEPECINLLKRLATEFKAQPILQAGESKLRKISRQLMFKPILLEALVKHVARSNMGIDDAVDNVFKKSNEDLLEFLYEDAWLRMNNLQQEVFLTLIHLSSPLDQNSIGKTCQELGIQHTEFQSGLEETHFSITSDYGRTYSIEFVDLARRFFLQQFSKLNKQDQNHLRSIASKADKYSENIERVEREYKSDRVAEAFRSEYAKAAKVAGNNGDITNAIELFELAIEDDPLNSSLHDRFSWFLLNRSNNYTYAQKLSEKAVELDPSNCNAIVGLSLVHYRLENIDEGDNCIDRAQEQGRSISFCMLRKAIARYHKSKNVSDIDARIALIEECIKLLNQAEKQNSKNGGYDAKVFADTKRYQTMSRREQTNLRSKKTKLSNKGAI